MPDIPLVGKTGAFVLEQYRRFLDACAADIPPGLRAEATPGEGINLVGHVGPRNLSVMFDGDTARIVAVNERGEPIRQRVEPWIHDYGYLRDWLRWLAAGATLAAEPAEATR